MFQPSKRPIHSTWPFRTNQGGGDDLSSDDGTFDSDEPRPEFIARSKKPTSLMFLGVISSTGEVCEPIWFPAGFRLKAVDYIEVLRTKVIPWMREVAQNRPFTFQQDSAPAHSAQATQAFLKEEGV